MFIEPTECSGFTAGLDTPYNLLIVDPPRSAPLHDKSLRWSFGRGSWDRFAARLFAEMLSSLPPFGGTRLCSSPLRLWAFGQVPFVFGDRFTTPLCFISRSRAPSATGEGGVPNTYEATYP